jgi:tetratricopeptide (TPR) repeat protein
MTKTLPRGGVLWLLLGLVGRLGAARAGAYLPSGQLPLERVGLDTAHAMEELAFVGLGMRRQDADLHFIRLLQYYGESEPGEEEGPGPHLESGGGNYPEIYPRALRLMELDPYFRYGCLYAAGALAFNLNRPEQAVSLLRAALQNDPKAWQYHLYLAAVAYKKEREFGKLVDVLEPALKDPGCPALLKSIVAGIYRKMGMLQKALALYQDIVDHSKDEGLRQASRERIRRILEGRP